MRIRRPIYLCLAISIIFLALVSPINAQRSDTTRSVEIIVGAGNYEYLYSGINIPLFKTNYTEIAIGIKPWDFQSEFYAMMYVDAGLALFTIKKHPAITTFIQPKIVTWYFNNEYNRFLFIGLGGEIRVAYALSERVELCGSLGALYNLELSYERKTYEEVGYPKELQPSCSIQLAFRLK